MSGFAWVTLATNDSYSLGALVLGHALKQASTIGQLVVLVTPGVTSPMRTKLSAVFNVVEEVNILDSKDEANLRLLKRPELGVTFTKLHCWRLTQFEKCVFLDADTLILSNCDELFQREEFSAAPDVGWPDCFNSGVFVFKPSNDTYESLIKFALENGSFDGGDQGLLNLFFSDWAHKDISKRLPFIYNMCSVASYSYLPAFKQYGGQVKIVHFIGVTKPWLQYFETESKQVQPAAGMEHLSHHLQLWWNIFCEQVHSVLTPDMFSAAQKNSSDKRLEQSTNYTPTSFNTSFDKYLTFPAVIPDPWLNYGTTDFENYSHKPSEPHNTNATKVKDTTNEESVQVISSESELDDAIHINYTENADLDLDDNSQSRKVITDNAPSESINITIVDHTSSPEKEMKILINSPSSSGEKAIEDQPDLPPDDNSEEGLASAFAQFSLGSRRSENQSALEDHLRRQSWEVGNIDYLGRDCFSNIWTKISETMADSVPEKERKEEQGIARTPIAPPKPIFAQEILVCDKPDTVQQTNEQLYIGSIGNQSSQIPTSALKLQESQVECSLVTLQDILRPITPREPISVCEKPMQPSTITDETKVATCEIKSMAVEVAAICETKPAELKDTPLKETKPANSSTSIKVVENIEEHNVILTEGEPVGSTPQALGPICDKAVPICQKQINPPLTPVCEKPTAVCEKQTAESEALDQVCQKPGNICEKALPIVPVCQKAVPVGENAAEGSEKVVDKPIDKPAPIPEHTLTPSTVIPLSIDPPEISSSGSPVASTPAAAAIPLGPPSQEESKAPIAVGAKPIDTIESNVSAQPLDQSINSDVSIEKQQECKANIPDLLCKPQDNNGNKNNKNNKKNNRNGKQDGKQQCKGEKQAEPVKGNKPIQKDTKPTDISSDVAKSEEKASTTIPLPAVAISQKQETEISVITPSTPIPDIDVKIQQKPEEAKKQNETPVANDSPIPFSTEPKPSHEPVRAGDGPTVQDHKDKKTEKQKKDNGLGEKKVDKSKELQKSDNANNKEDKKGGDKQAKSESKKDVAQKPEHQSKNVKKGSNKGDIKGKKEDDEKFEEKVEPKSDSKPQKVESKLDPSPESEPITKLDTKSEHKAEVKVEEILEQKEKPESKPQQKSDNKSTNKQGKDGKAEDKRKSGGKEQKPQAPPPPKQKGKDQSVAPKQEAVAPVPVAAIAPTTAAPAIPAAPPVPVQAPLIPDVTKPTGESPVVPATEMSSSQTAQKQSSGCAKKEPAPTPPPRKGNNGAKKGCKKK